MMDHERQEKELQEVFEATQQAYRVRIESILALQERTLQFARSLLETQDESNKIQLEELTEQSKKQREAVENLMRDSTEDFMEVLLTPFSHHHRRRVGKAAEERRLEGTQSS